MGSDSGFSRGGLEGSDYVFLNNVSTQCEDSREVCDLGRRGRKEGVARNAANDGAKRFFLRIQLMKKSVQAKMWVV